MKSLTVEKLIEIYNKKGYPVNTKNMQLNIFGIRNSDTLANTFDDTVGVFFKDLNGRWVIKAFDATTDPGLYYRENPMNSDGTAIIVPGFHKACYKLGVHKGLPALEQIAPMKYVRDANKNKVLDFLYKVPGFKYFIQNGKTNIHRAGKNSKIVDKWSAGCQVLANEADMEDLLLDVRRSIAYGHSNIFDYALFQIEDFV